MRGAAIIAFKLHLILPLQSHLAAHQAHGQLIILNALRLTLLALIGKLVVAFLDAGLRLATLLIIFATRC